MDVVVPFMRCIMQNCSCVKGGQKLADINEFCGKIQRLTSIAITVFRWSIFTLQQQKSRFSSSVAIVTNDIDLLKKDYKTEVQNCTLRRQKKLVNGP